MLTVHSRQHHPPPDRSVTAGSLARLGGRKLGAGGPQEVERRTLSCTPGAAQSAARARPGAGRGEGCGQGACLGAEVTRASWAGGAGAQGLRLHKLGQGWG